MSLKQEMKNYIIFLELFFLLSFIACSNKKERHEEFVTEEKGSSINRKVFAKIDSIIENETKWKKLELKEELDRYFKNTESLVEQNEFGGGDCWGTFKEFKTKINGFYATENKLDCGDNGFTRLRLIHSDKKMPLILEKKYKEWLMSDTIRFLIKEWIVDLNDTSKIYYREYMTDTYSVVDIPESIDFYLDSTNKLDVAKSISSINNSRKNKSK